MGRPKLIEDAELLAIAKRVFRDVGPTAKTVDVARAAGISEAAIFKRFKTKDALFFAALSGGAANLEALAALDPARHTPRSYLAAFGALAQRHFRENLPSILTLAAHPKQGYGAELMREIHKHNRAGEISAILVLRLRDWQACGALGPGNVVHFAHLFLLAIHSKAFVDVLSGDDDSPARPQDMESLVAVLWDGLAPRVPAAQTKRRRAAQRARTGQA